MAIGPQIGPQIGTNLLTPTQPTATTPKPTQNLFSPVTSGGLTVGPQVGFSPIGDLQKIQQQPEFKQSFDTQQLDKQKQELQEVVQSAQNPSYTQGVLPDIIAPKSFVTKAEQQIASKYYDPQRLFQGINETMSSGQTTQQLTPYEKTVISQLQTAIENGLEPNPQAIMEAVPGIPYDVAFAIAKQQPQEPAVLKIFNGIKDKYKQYKDAFNPLTPVRKLAQAGIEKYGEVTGKPTDQGIGYVDPTFKFKEIRGSKADLSDPSMEVGQYMVDQLAVPEFILQNTARLIGNLPSAGANMAIFASNLLLDPELTLKQFADGISQLPEQVREEIPFYATPGEKIQGVVNGIAKFVVENPDVIFAPESLIKGGKLARTLVDSPVGPGGMASRTIQQEIFTRMKDKGIEITPENVIKESNLLYDDMLAGKYTEEGTPVKNTQEPTAETTPEAEPTTQSTVYEGTNAQGEIVTRPQVEYRETIPGVDKEIQEVFGQTIVGVKKPADVVKKTDQQISTMETILDNKDNLPTIFDDKGNVASDISVMKYAEGVSQTMDDFWQNVISPVEQGLEDLNVKPDMKDISYAIESINKSLEDMKIAGEVTPIARKAYETLQEYKMILGSENMSASDLWKLSKELNAATKQLYNGGTLSPANLRLQTELAGLNVIIREMFEKVVDNMLDVPELRDLKRQRGDMRGSIKQITKRGQVLDRKAPVGLTQTLGDAFGGASVIGGLISMNPAAIAQGIGLKLITDYIRNLNNPNKKLRKLLEKMDKQRQGFRVPGGFAEGSPVSEGIANKVQSQVATKKAEAAAVKRRQQIQKQFTDRMMELETPALVVGGIEIMPDGTIKQKAIAPKPKLKSIIEVDTVTPKKNQAKLNEAEQGQLAKQAEIEAEKRKVELAKKMVEEQSKMADEMLYEYAKNNGELVEGSDVFYGLKEGDVTPVGIVERVYLSGTKAEAIIKGQKMNVADTGVQSGQAYRVPGDAQKRLQKYKDDIKDSLDTEKTPATPEFADFLEEMELTAPKIDPNDIEIKIAGIDDFTKRAYNNAMQIFDDLGIEIGTKKPSQVLNELPIDLRQEVAATIKKNYDNVDKALPELKSKAEVAVAEKPKATIKKEFDIEAEKSNAQKYKTFDKYKESLLGKNKEQLPIIEYMSNKYPIKNIDEAMSSNDLLKKFWEESKPKQGNLLKKPTVDTNKSFMEEAKKYKSAEEFVKSQKKQNFDNLFEDAPILTEIKNKYPDVNIMITENPNEISLSKIIVPKDMRGQGIGTKVMKDLVDYSEKVGKRVLLTTSSDFGGSVGKLKEFYKRAGFIENKGRNRDFSTREQFIYTPKTTQESQLKQIREEANKGLDK